jgi:anti-anti-sigma regulatory factor
MSEATLLVFTDDSGAYLQVAGRATFKFSECVKAFCLEVIKNQTKCIRIDLSKCDFMDSTFMGILAMVGIEAMRAKMPVEIVNAGDANRKLLFDLGLKQIFKYVDGVGEQAGLSEVTQSDVTMDQYTENVKDAHQTLVDVYAPNREKFQDILEFINQTP